MAVDWSAPFYMLGYTYTEFRYPANSKSRQAEWKAIILAWIQELTGNYMWLTWLSPA